VTAVERRWPHILLQWEDFAGVNAAACWSAIATGSAPSTTTFRDRGRDDRDAARRRQRHRNSAREQTIAMFGSGSAGIGIVDLLIAAMKEQGLSEEQARKPHLRIQSLRPARRRRQGHSPDRSRWPAQARGRCRMEAVGAQRETGAFRCSTWCAMPASPCWPA
jgi:malate dehydrogenase (oxaloacetate-decarboxylating)